MGYGRRALELLGNYYDGKILRCVCVCVPGVGNGRQSVGEAERGDLFLAKSASVLPPEFLSWKPVYNKRSMGEDGARQKVRRLEAAEADVLEPRKNTPPLLSKLTEVPPEHLDYLGVSFGMTAELFKFWSTNGFAPVYVRQTEVRGVFCLVE